MTHASVAGDDASCRDSRVPKRRNEEEEEPAVPGLGDRLRIARKKAGLTQEAAAQKVDVASGTYSKYEGDKLGMTVGVLLRIADTFDASADELLGRPRRAEHVDYDDDAPNEQFEEFLKMTNVEALGVTEQELEHVRRAPFRGGARSWMDYQRALLALLNVDQLPQPEGLLAAKARAEARKGGSRTK